MSADSCKVPTGYFDISFADANGLGGDVCSMTGIGIDITLSS